MTSSDYLSSNNRFRPVTHLNLSGTTGERPRLNDDFRSSSPRLPGSPQILFRPIGPIPPVRYPPPNIFHFPRPPSASTLTRRNVEFQAPEQDILDRNFFQTFNMGTSTSRDRAAASNSKTTDDANLIDMGVELIPKEFLSSGNVYELFDPLKDLDRPHSCPITSNESRSTPTPPFLTPSQETPPIPIPSSQSHSHPYPYPIKLRLKLTIFPEIKPFSQLVQRIRSETRPKQVKIPH